MSSPDETTPLTNEEEQGNPSAATSIVEESRKKKKAEIETPKTETKKNTIHEMLANAKIKKEKEKAEVKRIVADELNNDKTEEKNENDSLLHESEKKSDGGDLLDKGVKLQPDLDKHFNPVSSKRPRGWALQLPIAYNIPQRKLRLAIYISSMLLVLEIFIAVQVSCLYYEMCFNSSDFATGSVISNLIVPISLALLFLVVPQGFNIAQSQTVAQLGISFSLSLIFCVTLCICFVFSTARFGDISTGTLAESKAESSLAEKTWTGMTSREQNWYNNNFESFQDKMRRNALIALICSLIAAILLAVITVAMGYIFIPAMCQLRRHLARNSLPM